ncbi:ParA family protein [Rubrobacter aplysinae]|uniref:ParA family protein n=1 Tax=Rubrobacter aplysinae TaxID=909625 RepID=UPI00064BDE03|nr:ParA family protein [Rubrobacter aplysinae]
MAITIALTNQKGGVSKTTTVLNLGHALARKGRRVLLVDLDPQASLTLGLNVSIEEAAFSLFGVIEAGDNIREIVLDLGGADGVAEDENGGEFHEPASERLGAVDQATPGGLESETSVASEAGGQEEEGEVKGYVHLAPAHISMSALDTRLKEEMGYHTFLAEALEAVAEDYDFVLIDCRPALDALETNAMYAADYLIIPVETNKYSLYATKDLGEFYQKVRDRLNPGLRILGVLFTRVESRTRLSKEVIERVSTVFGDSILNTQIRKNVRLAEVPGSSDSIFDYAPASHGAQDYMSLAEEVIERVG